MEGISFSAIAGGIITALSTLVSGDVAPSDPELLNVYTINREWNQLYSKKPADGVWETPKQTFTTKSGDSEDLTFAKLFNLLQKGYDENRVKAALIKESGNKEMVVVYTHSNGRKYVLQSDTNRIQSIEKRGLFEVVYEINREGIEVTAFEQLRHDPEVLSKWSSLVKRMKNDGDAYGDVFKNGSTLRINEKLKKSPETYTKTVSYAKP